VPSLRVLQATRRPLADPSANGVECRDAGCWVEPFATLLQVPFGTVKQWSDDEGWGVLISPEVPGEVWAHFSHIVDDDESAYRLLNDGERVRFDYEQYPPGQDGYFWRAIWVVGVSDDSEYAVLTDEGIMDRIRQIDERRRAPSDEDTYMISERIDVVDASSATDDNPPRTR
jgi:CspA family cold shock protein